MKSILNFLVLLFGLLLTSIAHAETPHEQLQQMVEQLQKTPNDNALREKIIKLAPTLKPSPTLPDAAITFEGRAQFAFKNAKSPDDFLAAAQEYEKAVAAAPWVPGYYADLCTIYEKADRFEDAKRHCKFYLSGLRDPAQMTDVKRRIAGLEFGIEKAEKTNSPQAREAAEQQAAVAPVQRLEGDWYRDITSGDASHSGNIYLVTLSIKRDARGAWRVQMLTTENSKVVADHHPYDIQVVGTGIRFKTDQTLQGNGRIEITATNEISATLTAGGNILRLAYTYTFTPNQETYWTEWSKYRPQPHVDEYKRQ